LKLKAAAVICLIVCAFLAIPFVMHPVFAQTAEVSTMSADSYNTPDTSDGGVSEPQGLPIDTPGGPT